ncbi:hypothetical protein DRO61_10970 [Candidatus Bathyarchaeota archaeon]|nr:MAG: hypothetical protein DRO61_10970 [Candidatus Bathyarchaeota archaeon]
MAISTAAAIIGSTVIGAGASILGGKAAGKGAEAAGATSAAASRYATDIQQEQYEQTRADQEPWRIAGEKALQVIQDTPDFEFSAEDFENFKDPAYEFRMEEGVNALDRSAASRGRLLSGAQDRAVTRYGSNLASQEYGNAFSRSLTEHNVALAKQQGLAGVGQSATNVVSSAGQNMASNVGNIMTSSATQQGNALMAGANAKAGMYSNLANTANQGIGNYLLYSRTAPTAPLQTFQGV